MSDFALLPWAEDDSGSAPAPAAALPPVEDELEALPPAAELPLGEVALEEREPGHEQVALGVFIEPLTDVSPILPCTFVWSGHVQHALGAEPPADALPLTDVAQTAPIVDLVQGTHDRLYSRLFQS